MVVLPDAFSIRRPCSGSTVFPGSRIWWPETLPAGLWVAAVDRFRHHSPLKNTQAGQAGGPEPPLSVEVVTLAMSEDIHPQQSDGDPFSGVTGDPARNPPGAFPQTLGPENVDWSPVP